jgi:hypothetical protein
MGFGDWIHLSLQRMQESRFSWSAAIKRDSAVDTLHRLPYSALGNEFTNPSPPSSSRHSAALDEVCIAIR